MTHRLESPRRHLPVHPPTPIQVCQVGQVSQRARVSLLALTALLGCGSSPAPATDTSADDSSIAKDARAAESVVYLAQGGSDQNDGHSPSLPKGTWDAAIRAAGPGGTVYLSGRYFNQRIVIHASGSEGRPVTLKPDPANRGYVDGGQSKPAGTWREDNLIRIYGHDIVWDGIEIVNSPWNGLGFDDTGARGVVRRTKVHNIYMQPLSTSADDTLFEDNDVYDTELSNYDNTRLEGVWGSGIGTGWNWTEKRRVRRFTARRNKIRDNWGENISAFQCEGFTIADNDISPKTAVGIYADNAANGVIERNWIHDGKGRALAFSSEPYGYTTLRDPPHDITWRNNVTRNCDFIAFIRDGRKTYYNLRFIGNTFYNTDFYVDRADEGGARGNEFVDNVLDGNFHLVDMAAWSIHHNAWPRGNAQGSNALTGDPRFVNPAAATPEGLKIAPASPLRRAGAARSDLTTDYFGAARPSPPSIGAHEPM
ncbi:right-handed parallel beta-helix repeat-containing protein [Pendulispora albinea]|uniref:Right-handed parallel beta-helix repeat-containing protein n=1 Tax=Pendulispora albinea TaxID=2741071 RepID=A0ABZ2M068_9BACT